MFEISIIHSYTRTVDEPSILILIYRFNKKIKKNKVNQSEKVGRPFYLFLKI